MEKKDVPLSVVEEHGDTHSTPELVEGNKRDVWDIEDTEVKNLHNMNDIDRDKGQSLHVFKLLLDQIFIRTG